MNTEILNFHLNCPFNFSINDILILLNTPKKPADNSFTFHPHFITHNSSQYPFSKKDLKRAFLLKYIILLLRYDCWCISLLYRHWNFEQEKDNSNVDNKCFCNQKHKSVVCKSHLFAQSVHKDQARFKWWPITKHNFHI